MVFSFILVPPAVFSWMQSIVNGAPNLMNSSSIHYSVKANLHPTTGIIVFYFHVKLRKIENDMKVRRPFSMSHIMCELVMKSVIRS